MSKFDIQKIQKKQDDLDLSTTLTANVSDDKWDSSSEGEEKQGGNTSSGDVIGIFSLLTGCQIQFGPIKSQ